MNAAAQTASTSFDRQNAHVRRLVDEAPLLSDEQRARLAAILTAPDPGTAA